MVLPLACYEYVPSTSTPIPLGRVARIQLTLDGTREVEGTLGKDVRAVSGIVRSATADSIVLGVTESWTMNGQLLVSSGATVGFPKRWLADVRLQRLSRKKTVVASAGWFAAAVGVFLATRGLGDNGEIPSPGPGPQPARVGR